MWGGRFHGCGCVFGVFVGGVCVVGWGLGVLLACWLTGVVVCREARGSRGRRLAVRRFKTRQETIDV